VKFGKMHRVTIPQGQGRKKRRARIGRLSIADANFRKAARIGMIRREPFPEPDDSTGRLASLQRLLGIEAIETPAGMGLNVAQRFVLLNQIVEHRTQQGMLVDVGQIPGMVGVLIRKHEPA